MTRLIFLLKTCSSSHGMWFLKSAPPESTVCTLSSSLVERMSRLLVLEHRALMKLRKKYCKVSMKTQQHPHPKSTKKFTFQVYQVQKYSKLLIIMSTSGFMINCFIKKYTDHRKMEFTEKMHVMWPTPYILKLMFSNEYVFALHDSGLQKIQMYAWIILARQSL